MAIIKKTIINKWSGYRKKKTLVHCVWECKCVCTWWEKVQILLKNLKPDLPYEPLLGIYLKKMKTLIKKDAHTRVFIAALFIIARM